MLKCQEDMLKTLSIQHTPNEWELMYILAKFKCVKKDMYCAIDVTGNEDLSKIIVEDSIYRVCENCEYALIGGKNESN